jgi:hypothetical protein
MRHDEPRAGELERIDPSWAIRPGRRDPLALLLVWFMRKSFYWMLGLGFVVAAMVGRVDEVGDSFDSPGKFWDRLLSPLVVALAALVFRFLASQLGLLLAYPFARRHDELLEPRTNFGSGIGRFMDRLHVARAYRSLRWTHHVRQVAIARLGRTGARLARLDPILDVANVVMMIAAFVALSVSGASTA